MPLIAIFATSLTTRRRTRHSKSSLCFPPQFSSLVSSSTQNTHVEPFTTPFLSFFLTVTHPIILCALFLLAYTSSQPHTGTPQGSSYSNSLHNFSSSLARPRRLTVAPDSSLLLRSVRLSPSPRHHRVYLFCFALLSSVFYVLRLSFLLVHVLWCLPLCRLLFITHGRKPQVCK